MVDLAVLPAFLLAAFLVTVAPGPDNIYIVAVALDRGLRAGMLSAVGMALGMVVHVAAAALGLAVLLRTAPGALIVVQVLGALYLGWLAVSTLRSAGTPGAAARVPPSDGRILGRAVLTNLSNPKVILFFAAFLPQFTRDGHGPLPVQMLTLGLIFLAVGLGWDSVVGLFAGRLGGALAGGGRGATALSVGAGLTFGVLALLLLSQALWSR
ncbi:LysE family translocator [Nonomuraea zeae]|uniref:LysE family translocator n=1 Tax=Nonomuraea zeae TaxID=1642303 RepID=A0A5S4H046_9ACTN|nr:LysE family translocator [Nonomuraea zeae]TMR38537.1 LysE family translocator [Nonomuraea zeae]